MVVVVVAMWWRGRGAVGGGGNNREAALRLRWQLCWQRLKVLVGGGGDDVVDRGGLSSLPQKSGVGKKNSRQIWESGDTGLYQRTRSKSVRTKNQKNKQISRQTTNKFDLWGHSI